MMHRKSANSKGFKKSFTRHAGKVHGKNVRANPMRGGFRL